MLVEHLGYRMEVHEHEPPTGFQDGGNAFGPGFEIGEPADDPVRGENDVEASAARSCLFQPVVDVRAFEERGYASPGRELTGSGYGLVAYVHAGNRGPEPGEAERVPAGVALQVGECLAVEFAEESTFLREEGYATPAQEGGEIPAVAVMRSHHRVPGAPVLLAKVSVDHERILPWGRSAAREAEASSRTRRKAATVSSQRGRWSARRRAAADIRLRKAVSSSRRSRALESARMLPAGTRVAASAPTSPGTGPTSHAITGRPCASASA